MKYNIKWCEVKKTGNTNGRDWKMTSMTLVDEQGKEHNNVTTFDEVVNGGDIYGEIVKKGEFLNFQKEKTTARISGPGGYRNPGNMTTVMNKKSEMIKDAQENKELGIKVSSTIRMAVDKAIAEGDPSEENIRRNRAWFWSEWDKEEKDFPPFR